MITAIDDGLGGAQKLLLPVALCQPVRPGRGDRPRGHQRDWLAQVKATS